MVRLIFESFAPIPNTAAISGQTLLNALIPLSVHDGSLSPDFMAALQEEVGDVASLTVEEFVRLNCVSMLKEDNGE